jgi:DNA-directed RNA polymerase specialized sigma24 family protein
VNALTMAIPSPKKARAFLTPEDFAQFLRWLSPDPELAIEEYMAVRKKLISFFIRKGCPEADVLFDETVDRVVKKVAEGGIYENRIGFCYGVARNVWKEYVRKPKPGPIAEDIASPSNHDRLSHEQQLQCLEACLEELSARDRDLITRFHRSQGRERIEARKRLAMEHGGDNTLRIKAFRIRNKLRACVNQCVKKSALTN